MKVFKIVYIVNYINRDPGPIFGPNENTPHYWTNIFTFYLNNAKLGWIWGRRAKSWSIFHGNRKQNCCQLNYKQHILITLSMLTVNDGNMSYSFFQTCIYLHIYFLDKVIIHIREYDTEHLFSVFVKRVNNFSSYVNLLRIIKNTNVRGV